MATSKKAPTIIDLLDSDDDDDVGASSFIGRQHLSSRSMMKRSSPPIKKKTRRERGGKNNDDDVSSNNSSTCAARQNDQKFGGRHSTTTTSGAKKSSSLAFGSYNVWFGREAGGKPHPKERMKELVKELLSKTENGSDLPYPLLVGLQEVSVDLIPLLLPLLESEGYDIILQELNDVVSYGCAVCVHTSLKMVGSGFTPFKQTMMGRGIVWALVQAENDKEILFTTSHLESFVGRELNDEITQNREAQARQWKSFCEECMKKRHSTVDLAICAADWNWDDVRIGARRTTKGPDKNLMQEIFCSSPTDLMPWIDCWQQSHPNEAGFTYDAKENPMLGGNLRRRFDRCLILGRKQKQTQVTRMNLIGTKSIAGLTWEKRNPYNTNVQTVPVLPSDHYGLLVDVEY